MLEDIFINEICKRLRIGMEKITLFKRIKTFFIGNAHDIRDPRIFHQITLIAFFAWVGLGADGLSSSCYGPQEAFLALGGHAYLSIFVAIAMALTILIISASYSQIIELFPSGGGGYVVASKLLSPFAGMAAGSALIIDYVLTITISIASGADAIFSFLPAEWQYLKLGFAAFLIVLITVMNLRGVKESILILLPIFLVFVITHAVVIVYAIFSHSSNLASVAVNTGADIKTSFGQLGFFGLSVILLRAYSMGAGT